MSDVFVSVVVPLQDDADVLEDFVREAATVLEAHFANYEMVLVDDASRDRTQALVGELLGSIKCIRYLRLARRFGTEAAIAAGLDSVIGDFTIVLQPANDPPALIPELVARARSGRGVVFGVRAVRTGESTWSAMGARLFWAFGRRYLDLRVPEGATYLQCLSRDAVNALTRIKDKYRSIRLMASHFGDEIETISYTPVQRRAVPRGRSFLQSVDLAVGVMVAQSSRPLRFVSLLGLAASVVNLLYMGYVLAIYLTRANLLQGWTTTSLQVSGMFFLLFLCLAVISEYLGRVLEESRDRPIYHAVEERNSNVMVRDSERRNVVMESR
ncbi:MAG: glycosyltransferase [Anaeromyxobacter sp.]|nr:glycosyltransferase [Anaeromyxobacter sp.]